MNKVRRTAVAVFSIVGLFLAGCSSAATATPTPEASPSVSRSRFVVAEGRVEPVRFAELALNTNGLVSEVLHKEGDAVKAGEVIALLENSQAKTLETAQAEALQSMTAAYEAVRDAKYRLDNFDVPLDLAGMSPAQAVKATEDRLNAARAAFEPYRYLDEKQLELTDAEKENPMLRSTPKRLKKEVDDSWGKYRKAVDWLDRDSALASALVDLARTQKDYASLQDATFSEDTAGIRAALASAEVRAPFAGTITNLDLKVGEFAASGTAVVTIADLSNWTVKTTDLTEIDVVSIHEGQTVGLTLDALPGVTLSGTILSIAQNFSEKQGDIVYKVTVLLSEKHPSMRWGMTAQVNFSQ